MRKIVEKYGEERVCAWVQSSIGCKGFTARAKPREEKPRVLKEGDGRVIYSQNPITGISSPAPPPEKKEPYKGLLG